MYRNYWWSLVALWAWVFLAIGWNLLLTLAEFQTEFQLRLYRHVGLPQVWYMMGLLGLLVNGLASWYRFRLEIPPEVLPANVLRLPYYLNIFQDVIAGKTSLVIFWIIFLVTLAGAGIILPRLWV